MQVQQETGVPYQLLLAIPANETGWGQAVAGNNYFGIKGSNPKTGANTGQVATWEVVGGQRQNIQDTFRAYDSPIESMRDFANLITTSARYSNVRTYLAQHPNDWRGATQLLLQDGYATDPNWASQVINLGNQIEGSPQPSAISPSSGIKSVVDTGAQAIGMKYQWGGAGGRGQSALSSNTDCSGFVSWAYEQATGVRLPAFTGDIYASTLAIGPNEAQPGDLVMYNMDQGPHMQHVGIYAGGNMMLHDSSINPNGGVDLTPLWSGAEFRRVPNVDPSLIQRQSMGAPPQTTQQPQQATGTEAHPPTVPLAQQRPLTENAPSTAYALGGGQEEAPSPTLTKREAGYTKRADEDFCQDCSMFRSGACTLVMGKIAPKATCDNFEPKRMGAGQDEGDDASDLSPERVQQIIATPGMGYQDYLDALRNASRQVADESQAPPVPQPADPTPRVLGMSSEEANAAVGRFDLTAPPDMQGDPNRRPIPRPSPLQPPQQGTPPVQIGPITLPGTASPDYVPPRRPITLPPSPPTPTPAPQAGDTGTVPDPDLAAHLGGGPPQPPPAPTPRPRASSYSRPASRSHRSPRRRSCAPWHSASPAARPEQRSQRRQRCRGAGHRGSAPGHKGLR